MKKHQITDFINSKCKQLIINKKLVKIKPINRFKKKIMRTVLIRNYRVYWMKIN